MKCTVAVGRPLERGIAEEMALGENDLSSVPRTKTRAESECEIVAWTINAWRGFAKGSS